MVALPQTGLGRFLLGVVAISTLVYFILNLVSFGGTNWITSTDPPITYGLWRVCDTSTNVCNQWADSVYQPGFINDTYGGAKPGYVRSSQALEIISLIFYILAAGIIVGGILSLGGAYYELMFFAAAGLLFICIIFLSASLGLMSAQGLFNSTCYRDWAWNNGLAGLIFIIICFVALIGLVFDLRFASTPLMGIPPSKVPRGANQQDMFNVQDFSSPMGGPFYNPAMNYYPQENYYNNNSFPNPMINYGDQYPVQQYFPDQNPMMNYGQSPSPLLTSLARNYIFQATDAQYEDQLLDPFRQYMQQPYYVQNYF